MLISFFRIDVEMVRFFFLLVLNSNKSFELLWHKWTKHKLELVDHSWPPKHINLLCCLCCSSPSVWTAHNCLQLFRQFLHNFYRLKLAQFVNCDPYSLVGLFVENIQAIINLSIDCGMLGFIVLKNRVARDLLFQTKKLNLYFFPIAMQITLLIHRTIWDNSSPALFQKPFRTVYAIISNVLFRCLYIHSMNQR